MLMQLLPEYQNGSVACCRYLPVLASVRHLLGVLLLAQCC